MAFSRLITILAVFLLILSGCGKKKQKEQVVEEKPVAKQTTDTADIFDEFYEDEGTSEPTISEEPSFASSEPEFVAEGRYVVQVSCVLSKDLAQDVVRQLEAKGYPAYIAEVENPTTELLGVYHRIRIGGFTGISKAKDFGENFLSRDGFEYWVDNKSNDNVGIGGYGLGESSQSSSYESSSYESSTTESSSYESSSYDTYEATPEPAATGSYETTTSEPAATESYETTTSEPAATESYETTTSEPAATESYETTTTSEPAATESTAPAASEPAGTSSDEWETSDDEWGSSGDEWGSDTTSW